MVLAAFAVQSPALYALWPAADNGGLALYAAAFRLRNGDNFGWRIEVAIAEPPPSILGHSTDRGDAWAENSVRNVRSSTNEDQFGKNGLEKDR